MSVGVAVAAFVLDRPIDVVRVPDGGLGHGASGQVMLKPLERPTREDSEDHVVIALAGSAACRELGVDDGGGESDDRVAATIARSVTSTADEAVDLLLEAHTRTAKLVGTPRFRPCSFRS
jgi:hypothetical protein